MCPPTDERPIRRISLQSSVRSRPPPLIFAVANSAHRPVIRKADAPGRRPFRVLSPFLATSYGDGPSLLVSRLRPSATPAWRPARAARVPLWPEVSVVSVSRLGSGYQNVRSALPGRNELAVCGTRQFFVTISEASVRELIASTDCPSCLPEQVPTG